MLTYFIISYGYLHLSRVAEGLALRCPATGLLKHGANSSKATVALKDEKSIEHEISSFKEGIFLVSI